MRTLPIIVFDEGGQGGSPARFAVPRPGVLPFLGQRAVHALDLAVLPGAAGPRADMAGALGLEQRVELSAAVARAVVGHHALDPHAHALEEAQAPAHERRAGTLALVGRQLGVGDPAEVVDGDAQAGRARAPRGAAAAPQGAVAAAGHAGRFLDVDAQELARPLPLVAHGGDRAAAARLPGHAVDVGEPRHAPPGDDPRARARRHARRGRQPERGEQHRGAGLADPLLDIGRLLRSESPSPDLLLRSRLPAVWRLIPIWRAASATPRPDSMRETSVSRPFGVSFALGCCSTGGLLRYESRQLTACGNPPYLSPADVNNVLALNS